MPEKAKIRVVLKYTPSEEADLNIAQAFSMLLDEERYANNLKVAIKKHNTNNTLTQIKK